jgi:anti-sigma regulatory factor (Ser/Thr protein kinase)
VAEAVERSAVADVESVVGTVLASAAAGQGYEDDVALVVCRFVAQPATVHIRVPAELSVLRGLRQRLNAWLASRGLTDSERADTVLAVSEACNNAVEHAYGDGKGAIDLVLSHRDHLLRIEIEDDGTWRKPRQDTTRGRGILIMRGLMDTAVIDPGDDGTSVALELQLGR